MNDEGLREKIARIDENVALLRKDLLGNGQPGRLTKLEVDVEALKNANAKRMGAMSVLSLLVTVATTWLLGKLGWR